jgi:hypothetical protein
MYSVTLTSAICVVIACSMVALQALACRGYLVEDSRG